MQKHFLTLFCFFIYCLSLFGQETNSYPLITIQEKSIKTESLLQEITNQSGLDFSYQPSVVDLEKTLAFKVRNETLENTLVLLCKKIDVVYVIIEGQIVLTANTQLQQHMFTGYISDAKSGETLLGATVFLKGSTRGTFTNEFGYFALPIPNGKQQIEVSYLGYNPRIIELLFEKDTLKNITLSPMPTHLPEILIGLPMKDVLNKKQLGEMEIHPDELNSMPEFAGESGLVKGLQTLPGIKAHGDASAFFYTRGGERDQNLIIIDDAPVYNPSHLFGVFSLVIPEFTKSIKVYKSDIPATMGDRLSSIVSIRTKDGNLNKAQFGGAISPWLYRFSVETPIVKQKSAFFLSFRRSNFEWLYKRNSPNANLFFQDIHLKFNWKINDKNRLFFTTIAGGDVLENNNQAFSRTGIRWGNFSATLRWNHIFSPKLFSNTTLYTGNYAYRIQQATNLWKSELGMLGLKSDFTHYVSEKYTAKFGFDSQAYFNTPGIFSSDSTISLLPEITSDYSRKLVLYYQGKLDITDKIRLNAGLRLINWSNYGPKTYYSYDENFMVTDTINAGVGRFNTYTNLDPRISVQYQLHSDAQLKLSYGIYHQYLQVANNAISPFSSMEIWLPASPNLAPQNASQWSLSYLNNFQKTKAEFSAAVFYKKMNNQIDFEGHATTLLNPFLEGELRIGDTKSYGIEFLFKKDFGRFNGWLGYTYSRAFRRTNGLNNNKTYSAFQDRPHDLSMLINFRLKRRIFCTAYWTSYSGSTFTSPVSFFEYNGQTVPIYGERNNDRLPTYHRLDLGMKFILNKKEDSKFQHSLTLSIYNFLAHKNVYAVRFNKIETTTFSPPVPGNLLLENPLSPSAIDVVRFFPTLTYKFKI